LTDELILGHLYVDTWGNNFNATKFTIRVTPDQSSLWSGLQCELDIELEDENSSIPTNIKFNGNFSTTNKVIIILI